MVAEGVLFQAVFGNFRDCVAYFGSGNAFSEAKACMLVAGTRR